MQIYVFMLIYAYIIHIYAYLCIKSYTKDKGIKSGFYSYIICMKLLFL